MTARAGCAVLAAGGSRRLGRPKQLERLGGTSLVRRAVGTATRSRVAEVAVVLGASATPIALELTDLRVEIVPNELWSAGLSSSVRAAARWAMRRGLDALVLVACDQPLLTAAHLDALIARHDEGALLVASTYDGCRGVPALFGEPWLERLASLDGPCGAAVLLRAAPSVEDVPWEDGVLDVDTEADVTRAHEALSRARPETVVSRAGHGRREERA